MFTSNIPRRQPHGKAMPERIARANDKRPAVRSAVEQIYVRQKHRTGLMVRTVRIARGQLKIGMAHLAYKSLRLALLQGRTAPA